MAINLNVSPYFDDYDPRNKFYRILFRPRIPIQARELTQLQTILQEQIKRFGDHVFENKSLVIPGEIKYDNRYNWIKIDKSFDANDSQQLQEFWKRSTITGASGVRALVVDFLEPNVDDEVVLFIKYISGGSGGAVGEFSPGESLTNDQFGLTPQVLNASPNPEGVLGVGTAAHISEGIYFVDGFFALVEQQSIVVDPFNDKATARIGLDIRKSIITPEDDESIKSNALGFPSFSAPGAHRLKIDLVLVAKPLNLNQAPDPEEEQDFIELLRLRNGTVVSRVDRSDYSVLEKTLARRTFDESGNYTVRDFRVEVREFYRENNNNGIYEDKDFFFETSAEAEVVAQERFGLTGWHFDPNGSGKAMPGETHDDFQEAARSLLVLGVEPGKAYVFGYEIETISKRLLDYRKARDFQHSTSSTIGTQVGNYVLVRDVNSFPDITSYAKVDLYDGIITTPGTPAGNKIGEARIRGIEYDSGPIASNMSNAIFKLFLFDIQLNGDRAFEQVKSIHHDKTPAGPGVNDFTCNINLEEFLLAGTVTQDPTGLLTGVGTFFLSREGQALRQGDWIVILDSSDNTKKYRQLTADPTSDSLVSVQPTGGGNQIVEPSTFSYVFAELRGVEQNALIFPLSNIPVRSIRNQANEVKTQLTVRREFSVVIGSGAATIALTDPFEDFVAFDQDDYFFTLEVGAQQGRVYNYNQISASFVQADPLLPQTAQATFIHPDFVNGETVRIVATIQKKGSFASQEKQKILVPGQILNTPVGQQSLTQVSLGKADIIKLVKITMSADFTTAATSSDIDITDRYELDNGQRDNFYDLGRILLKPNTPIPTGRLRIEFDFFEHSNANKNYFSVDSYPIPYADIPSYVSVEDGLVYNLRDCLDFRPRINDAGTGFDVVTGSQTEIPVKNSLADYSYFLNRLDKLHLDSSGRFSINYGVSGIIPNEPATIDNAMLLYNFETRAYTFKPQDVIQEKIDNRRYTMRDIGRIEKRVEKLEYYTSLSLLEKDTEDLLIRDENGLDRFKNGFIVDSFEGHGVGDVINPDYRCSIDMIEKQLRPEFKEDNFRLKIQTQSGVQKYGDLIMLTRTADEVAISQLLASETINVNPYAVFTFVGNIKLNPENDEWKETNLLPDLIVNIEGNYSQIEAQAEARGTVWGEWETNWTGRRKRTKITDVTRTPASQFAPGNRQSAHGFRIQTTSRTTVTKRGTQSRTGIRSTVIPEIVTENLGERVIDVSYIPFMRTRDVQFEAKGLKPNTRLYAFFDQIDVGQYVTADSTVYDPNNNILTGTPLVTDATGKAEGVFRIPGLARAGFIDTPNGLKFRTGEKMFRLTDSPNNSDKFGTAGEGQYRAQGILETKQNTILSIRNARLGQEIVSESESVVQRTSTETTTTTWIDPLAQSFLISDRGGIYISKVGLFFQTKDQNIPVTVQLREMVNGYPGQRILPFGEITIDALDINISDDATVETVFEFPSPVFIPEQTEACFVVLSNSNEYNVFIGRLGGDIIGTEIPIEEQPYGGVLFKSQNASTWTADQEADMMFKLYKAQWETNQTGSVILTNDEDDVAFLKALRPNPLQFVSGSNKIRVSHPDHSMPSIPSVQSRVVIDGVQPTLGSSIAGIPLTEINGVEFIVTEVDTDFYTIETVSSATETTLAGGNQVIATQNLQMDALYSIIGEFILPETNITYGIRTTTGRSPHAPLSIEPYKVEGIYRDHIPNSTVEFNNQRIVASEFNEQSAVIPGGSKTFFMLGSLRTTNPNLSPAIDSQRMSIVTVANRISDSSFTGTNSINFEPFDIEELVTDNTNIDFNAADNSISVDSDTATIVELRKILVGRYIEISGATLNNANKGFFRVTKVTFDALATPQLKIFVDATLANDSGEATTIKYHQKFIDERSPQFGSALSKYVTRRFVLAEPAIGLKILAAMNKPSGANIDLYYKISKIDETGRFDDFPYIKAEWDSVIPDSLDENDFREITATINNIPDFSIVAVKLVMRGTNTARVPKVKDLRVIALGT